MSAKVGRNDPCPCGSGKKYKNCCLSQKAGQEKPRDAMGRRKFTAKLLSGAGAKQQEASQSSEQQMIVDYGTLMERSFGSAIHSVEEKPPLPVDPNQYLAKD